MWLWFIYIINWNANITDRTIYNSRSQKIHFLQSISQSNTNGWSKKYKTKKYNCRLILFLHKNAIKNSLHSVYYIFKRFLEPFLHFELSYKKSKQSSCYPSTRHLSNPRFISTRWALRQVHDLRNYWIFIIFLPLCSASINGLVFQRIPLSRFFRQFHSAYLRVNFQNL